MNETCACGRAAVIHGCPFDTTPLCAEHLREWTDLLYEYNRRFLRAADAYNKQYVNWIASWP